MSDPLVWRDKKGIDGGQVVCDPFLGNYCTMTARRAPTGNSQKIPLDNFACPRTHLNRFRAADTTILARQDIDIGIQHSIDNHSETLLHIAG